MFSLCLVNTVSENKVLKFVVKFVLDYTGYINRFYERIDQVSKNSNFFNLQTSQCFPFYRLFCFNLKTILINSYFSAGIKGAGINTCPRGAGRIIGAMNFFTSF